MGAGGRGGGVKWFVERVEWFVGEAGWGAGVGVGRNGLGAM